MPGDPPAEPYMHYSKSRGHKDVPPSRGREKGHYTKGHQAHAHDRNNARGKGAACDDGSSVEQKPDSGESGKHAGLKKNVGQKTPDHDRRGKTQKKLAAGAGEELGIDAVSLCGGGGRGKPPRDENFHEPDHQPNARAGPAGSDRKPPTTIGGAKLKRNLRPGPEKSWELTR